MDTRKEPDRNDAQLKQLAVAYTRSLKRRPILTKACTSAVMGSLASIISIYIKKIKNVQQGGSVRSVFSYGLAGLVFVGPSVHHFHAWLEREFPKGTPLATMKKVLVDRIFFCPCFTFIYLYLLARFEGHCNKNALKNLSLAYWPALSVNWKIWTPLQYLNIEYIPQQFRPLFMSILALFWTILIAATRS